MLAAAGSRGSLTQAKSKRRLRHELIVRRNVSPQGLVDIVIIQQGAVCVASSPEIWDLGWTHRKGIRRRSLRIHDKRRGRVIVMILQEG